MKWAFYAIYKLLDIPISIIAGPLVDYLGMYSVSDLVGIQFTESIYFFIPTKQRKY